MQNINNNNRENIINFIIQTNKLIKLNKIKIKKINYSGKKVDELKKEVILVINTMKTDMHYLHEIILNSKINIENIDKYISIPKKI